MRFSSAIPLALAFASLATSQAEAIAPSALEARLNNGERLLIVDVRSSAAYSTAHIPSAINMPLDLLPHKKLPAGVPVIVYGDGLGVIADRDALAAVQSTGASNTDVLEGGFAAWQTHTSVDTAAAGLSRENIPGITYDQLVAADKEGIVLVDLRKPSAPAGEGRMAAAAESGTDVVGAFASKLNVPVKEGLEGATSLTDSARPGMMRAAGQSDVAPTPPLLVLVADDDATAKEAARNLRAAGYHRFTILVGGTEIIHHEGRRGMGRQSSDLPIFPNQP